LFSKVLRRIAGQIQTVTPTSIFGKAIIYQQAAVFKSNAISIFLKQVIADFWLRGLSCR